MSENRKVDWIFLLFLLFLTCQVNVLKLFAIVFILIVRPEGTLRKYIGKISFYYLIFCVLSIVYGLFYLKENNYIYPYLISVSLAVFCFVAATQIGYFIKKQSFKTILGTLNTFFAINSIASIVQFVHICWEFGTLNPFSKSPAAGDFISGIFSSCPENMIVNSFFVIFYFFNKNFLKVIGALMIMLLTGFMSGLVLFIVSLGIFLVFLSKLSFKTRFYAGLIVSVIVGGYFIFSIQNVNYAMGYINRIGRKNPPFKIVSFQQTLQYFIESPKKFLFGAGPSNFSSREAFIASGDYVDWYPKDKRYISNDFRKNHLTIWNHHFTNPYDNRSSSANQPFSFYNRIIGEYGFLGIMLFLVGYVMFFYQRRHLMTYGKLMMITLFFYLILDYWFQYISIILVFELLVLMDIKKNELEQANQDVLEA